MKTIRHEVDNAPFKYFQFDVSDEAPDNLIDWFSNWFTEQAIRSDGFEDGELVPMGFSLLKVQHLDEGVEVLGPDFKSWPVNWITNLYPALRTLALHKSVGQTYQLALDIPSMQHTALVGDRYELHPMFLSRSEKEQGSEHSGWFIVSTAADVDNTDEGQLRLMSLYEAAMHAPNILAYLALPEGSQVVFESERPEIRYRNEVRDVT